MEMPLQQRVKHLTPWWQRNVNRVLGLMRTGSMRAENPSFSPFEWSGM